ncbi:MAG: hypothetical protein LBC74_00915 [Planctomycetaceae bacterium]|nr:hypothetical protein [Planctomycetaceae bacterium]
MVSYRLAKRSIMLFSVDLLGFGNRIVDDKKHTTEQLLYFYRNCRNNS